jgi:hypothetical protein
MKPRKLKLMALVADVAAIRARRAPDLVQAPDGLLRALLGARGVDLR